MKNTIKTILLLSALSALLVGFGGMIGKQYLPLFLILALALNFGAYFFSDRVILKMQKAKPLDPHEFPWLHSMVSELSHTAEIPIPRVFIIPSNESNAFATGRNPKHGVVAVTQGILNNLSQRELRGVLAHEIAHIKNRDILVATLAAVVASCISYIANIVQFSAFFGGGRHDEEEAPNPLVALAMSMIAPIAALVIQMAISRSREYLADESAGRISRDPEALAMALEKLEVNAQQEPSSLAPATASLYIVNPFAGVRGLTRLFSTHPSTAERVKRLREMNVFGV